MKTCLISSILVLLLLTAQKAQALIPFQDPKITATRIESVRIESSQKEEALYAGYEEERAVCEQGGRIAGVVVHESEHESYTWVETTVYCFIMSSADTLFSPSQSE